MPEEYGGLGLDFGYNAVIDEELGYLGSTAGIGLHSDIVAPYIVDYGSEELKRHWLPRMISGETPTAIAMTEPGAGSDLQGIKTTAIADGDDYVVNGSKTYITNGQHAELIIVVAKTDPAEGAKGISLILVEADRAGFARGRNLDKIGLHGQDTSELFFQDVRVPQSQSARRGRHGLRLSDEPAAAGAAGDRGRRAGLGPARLRRGGEIHQGAQGVRPHRLRVPEHPIHPRRPRRRSCRSAGPISTGRSPGTSPASSPPPRPSAAKLWHTELQWEVCDAALQLHGGAGYMNEYLIARLWRDARVTRIFGGTNEIMKEVVARAI